MKYSKDGYKRNSKDKNNPYNIIPSGNITMKGVDFPVYGVDNLGNGQIMMPGADYTFPGNEVFEVPLIRQQGGEGVSTSEYLLSGPEEATVAQERPSIPPPVYDTIDEQHEERDFEKNPYKAIIYFDDSDPRFFSTDLERMIPELNEKYGEGNWLAQSLPGTVYTDEYQDKVNKFHEEYPFGHDFMVMKDEKVNLQGIHNSTIRALERIEERLNTLTKEGHGPGHDEFDSLLRKQEYYGERAPRIQDQILELSRQIDEIQANESWDDDFETTYSTLFHGKKPLKASAELTGYFDDIDHLDPKGDIIIMQHGNNKVGPIILSEADRTRIGNADNTPDVVDTFTEILKDKGFEGQCIMGVCGATEPEESNAYNIANETDATGISGKGTWSGYQSHFGDTFLENFYNLNNDPNFDPGSIIIYSPGDDAPILVRNDPYEEQGISAEANTNVEEEVVASTDHSGGDDAGYGEVSHPLPQNVDNLYVHPPLIYPELEEEYYQYPTDIRQEGGEDRIPENQNLENYDVSEEDLKNLESEFQKGIDYNKEWLSSPAALEMLTEQLGSKEEAQWVINNRLKNLEGNLYEDKYVTGDENVKMDDEYVLASSNRSTGKIKPYPYIFSMPEYWYPTGVHEGAHSSDRPMFYDNPEFPYTNDLSGFGNYFWDITVGNIMDPSYTWKYNHPDSEQAEIADGRLIPAQDVELINKLKIPIANIEDMDEEWYDYVSTPHEIRSRLMEIRSQADKHGIWNPQEKLTEDNINDIFEQLNQLEDNSGIEQLQDIFHDKSIMQLLNTVADKPEELMVEDELPYDLAQAQRGGRRGKKGSSSRGNRPPMANPRYKLNPINYPLKNPLIQERHFNYPSFPATHQPTREVLENLFTRGNTAEGIRRRQQLAIDQGDWNFLQKYTQLVQPPISSKWWQEGHPISPAAQFRPDALMYNRHKLEWTNTEFLPHGTDAVQSNILSTKPLPQVIVHPSQSGDAAKIITRHEAEHLLQGPDAFKTGSPSQRFTNNLVNDKIARELQYKEKPEFTMSATYGELPANSNISEGQWDAYSLGNAYLKNWYSGTLPAAELEVIKQRVIQKYNKEFGLDISPKVSNYDMLMYINKLDARTQGMGLPRPYPLSTDIYSYLGHVSPKEFAHLREHDPARLSEIMLHFRKAEPGAHLAEIQQHLMNKGLLSTKDYSKQADAKMIENVYNEYINRDLRSHMSDAPYTLRLFEAMEPNQHNFNVIAESLNKMLAIPPLIIGAGEILNDETYAPGYQKGGENENEKENKWEVKKYGLNEKKYKPASDWTEYEDYDYKDQNYKRRYFNINRNELDWYLSGREGQLFKDTRRHSKQPWRSLVNNTAGDMRVRETIKPNGKKSYALEYRGGSGWRTYAHGNDQSGLANLTPEFVTNLKKTGKGAIGQWSSWFDMSPKERKEYGMGEWYDQGYQRDLRFDNEGNTWSGWKYYGDKTPLHHRLERESLWMLPGSIKEKYNLVGGDQLRLDPRSGVIYTVSSSTGSHRNTISQKDMKWFENPGRLASAYRDPKFSNKHDDLLDYISNPNFRYYKDSETISLEPVTIDGIPTSPTTLPTRSRYVPKPASAAYTKTQPYGSGANPNLTPVMQEERDAYASFQNTLPENLKTDDPNYNMQGLWEAMGKPKTFKEAKKSDYWGAEGWVPEPYDNLYHGPSVGADGWLLKSDKHDTFSQEIDWFNSDDPAAEYQREHFNLVKDDTGYFGANQWRYVPKISETVEELMGQLKNTQGSSKINVSGQAILDATKREDYGNKDLMRDLRIFKDAYGQKNYEVLQKMLQKSEAPKAKYGAELIRFQNKGEVKPGMIAERLRNTVTPIGYSLDHALKEFISGKKLPFEWDGKLQTWETFGENLDLPPEQSDYIRQSSQDLWDKYLGFEPENNTISQSLFSPATAGLKGPINPAKKYYSFNWDDDIWSDVINYELLKKRPEGQKEINNIHVKDSSAGGFAMNNYKLSKGFDKERQLPYVSYYDEFDFDIPLKGPWQMAGWLFGEKAQDGSYTIPAEKIVGKPFEIYGRMYYDPDNTDLDGHPLRIPHNKIDNYHVDFNQLKVGIMATESANGQLLENPESTATGLYGQRFSELDGSDIFLGSRSEFAEDFAEQDKIFKQRFDGSLFDDQRGLKTDANEVYNEYIDQIDVPYNKTEIAALINFIGRQGTREYLGYVLRDGKPLEEVFPHLYGENAEQRNKTPEQYINSFRKAVEKYSKATSYEDYILNNLPKDIVEQLLLDYTEEQIEEKQFSSGGEYEKTDKKIERLQEQLEKFKGGGEISGLVKDELFEYGLIDDDAPKFQEGGESYTVQKNDNLSKIARKYNMSLSELLELNPEYKANPSHVRTGAKINITNTPDIPISKKGYDHFKTFSEAFEQARKDLGKNRIFTYKGSQFRTNLKGEPWTPSEIELEKNGLNNDSSANRIDEEQTLVDSIYSDKNTPDYEDAIGPWRNVEKKINNNKDINKLQNVEKILFYEMENAPDQNIEEITYTVKPGDFLGKIANENMTSINQILVDNGIDENTHIYPGQKLIVKRPSGNPFLVVDKIAGKTHLYYPGQNKPTRSYNVLIGENPGDQQTVTKPIDINQDGQITDADKVWKNGKKVWTYDWSAGNMQTGAGIFTISNVDANSGYWDETGQNRKVPSFNLTHERVEGDISMTIHGIPNTVNWAEKQERKKALYSKSADDNRQSYGCINMKCGDLNELLGTVQMGTKVYVLPENSGVGDWKNENQFHYQDGQLVFKGKIDNWLHPDDRKVFEQWKKDNPYEEWIKNEREEKGKKANPQDYLKSYPYDLNYSDLGWYQDSEGEWREGQGIMTSKSTIKYHPVSISIDKNKVQEVGLDYNSHAAQEEMEFQKYTEPYLNAIVKNKKQILNVLQELGSGVSSDIYDMIIPTTFGIYGVESGMGNINPEIVNLYHGAKKIGEYGETNPDVIRKYHSYPGIANMEYKGKTFSAKSPGHSVGWTQVKWGVSLDDMEKKILAKLGITSQKDFMDPEKAAIGTQAILTYRYNSRTERLTPEQKSDQDFVRDHLANTWNPDRKNYSKRVSNYYPLLDIYSLDIADTNEPGRLDVQGEYEPQGFWQELGNILLQPFPNAPYSHEVELPVGHQGQDAVGKDNMFGVGTPKIKYGGAKKQNIPGGSFDLATQIRIYNEYIDGNFDNTVDQKAVKNFIDKINRLYYTDAKKKGRHVYDHIRKL